MTEWERPRAGRTPLRGWRLVPALCIALLSSLPAGRAPAGEMVPLATEPAASVVTAWSAVADRLGQGSANWRTMAIMHLAMHDALNAAETRYARFLAPGPQEPPSAGAAPDVALAAAAFQVLLIRHSDQAKGLGEPLFNAALRRTAATSDSVDAGIRLGAAIALATNARLTLVSPAPHPFPVGTGLGEWRATPPFLQRAYVADYKPILAEESAELHGPPPPAPDTPRYMAEVAEARRLGGEHSTERTPAQTEAAEFWGRQSTQRNMVRLAARLLAERPPADGLWGEARAMAMLGAALADAFVVAWDQKQRYGYWRPITAITLGGGGVTPDARWEPLLPTPPHPDYPSGHATDCSAGATVLQALFGPAPFPVVYVTIDTSPNAARRFSSLAALTEECMLSRIWAGAHFRAANEEGVRLGRAIAERALAAMPVLPSR